MITLPEIYPLKFKYMYMDTTLNIVKQPHSQGLSSSRQTSIAFGGKKRDPGNKVDSQVLVTPLSVTQHYCHASICHAMLLSECSVT